MYAFQLGSVIKSLNSTFFCLTSIYISLLKDKFKLRSVCKEDKQRLADIFKKMPLIVPRKYRKDGDTNEYFVERFNQIKKNLT